MKFKRYDKRFLPMLFIGLGIWVGAMVLAGILSNSGQVEGQSTLMEMIKGIFQSWPVFTLLLLCVFQPILEEFSFRLWGVGKMWMTIVCLALMTLFGVSEMGLWMLLFLGAFLVVWLKVKDTFLQRWILALLTSLCFALCHISGFGSFGWGMVLGLLDIFGMALVMCWLTINLSFWFSCLLHVGNNSLAIILPMLMVSDPVANTYTLDNGIEMRTELRAKNAFARGESFPCTPFEMTYMGEPAEIAKQMLQDIKSFDDGDFSAEPYYDWLSLNEGIEERLIYHISVDPGATFTYRQVLECYLKDYEAFSEESLAFDTTEAELQEVNLVYLSDNSVVNVNSEDVRDYDFTRVMDRVTRNTLCRSTDLFVSYAAPEDTLVRHYALPTTREKSMLMEQMDQYAAAMDVVYGFRLEYVPTGKKVKLITVK